jgi:AraC-like DNA-binding protein
MYAPLSLDSSLARHTVSKIQRWAFKLANYNYRLEHIAGELRYSVREFTGYFYYYYIGAGRWILEWILLDFGPNRRIWISTRRISFKLNLSIQNPNQGCEC